MGNLTEPMQIFYYKTHKCIFNIFFLPTMTEERQRALVPLDCYSAVRRVGEIS